MGLRQNSGMDRPAVIQTYGTVWITCVLVWIGALHFDSQPYIIYRYYIYIHTRIRPYVYIIERLIPCNFDSRSSSSK